MRLALLRHGIAFDHAATDFDRALTPEGIDEVLRVAEDLAGLGWRPGVILHSPLVRAEQTATLVREVFPDVPLVVTSALAEGEPDAMLRATAGRADPLLVGHEPSMGALASLLVGGRMGSIRMERAGFALFEVDGLPPRRPGRLLLFLPPRRAGSLAVG
jgi:phosphohistidine phosphatase